MYKVMDLPVQTTSTGTAFIQLRNNAHLTYSKTDTASTYDPSGSNSALVSGSLLTAITAEQGRTNYV